MLLLISVLECLSFAPVFFLEASCVAELQGLRRFPVFGAVLRELRHASDFKLRAIWHFEKVERQHITKVVLRPMPFTLYMLMIGCRVAGRHTEQHDTFFAIAETPAGLIPKLNTFWPEARGRMHVDALRAVTLVDGYSVSVQPRKEVAASLYKLFFLNLGGYKQDVFDEFHYKMVAVAATKSDAIKQARQKAFYKHTGFAGAPAHIDDKWGVDVDDVYEINDILPAADRAQFSIHIEPGATGIKDTLHLGYITFDKLAEL